MEHFILFLSNLHFFNILLLFNGVLDQLNLLLSVLVGWALHYEMDLVLIVNGVRALGEVNEVRAILDLNLCFRDINQDGELLILLGPVLLINLVPHEHRVQVYHHILMVQDLFIQLLEVIFF
jgi:hypothetical protein